VRDDSAMPPSRCIALFLDVALVWSFPKFAVDAIENTVVRRHAPLPRPKFPMTILMDVAMVYCVRR